MCLITKRKTKKLLTNGLTVFSSAGKAAVNCRVEPGLRLLPNLPPHEFGGLLQVCMTPEDTYENYGVSVDSNIRKNFTIVTYDSIVVKIYVSVNLLEEL